MQGYCEGRNTRANTTLYPSTFLPVSQLSVSLLFVDFSLINSVWIDQFNWVQFRFGDSAVSGAVLPSRKTVSLS